MIIKSNAKINLFLEVLGKNEKNYHLLESLICFIDISDQIKIKKSYKLSLKFSGKYADFLRNDKTENIILKTIKFMSDKFDFEPNLEISLEKNIPIGAGIGGGSSNSASIILAMNKIFKLNLSQNQMMEIGLKMGCDVPVCLSGKLALVEGIGEKITQINPKSFSNPYFALIVNPNKFLSTKEVFKNLTIKDRVENFKTSRNLDIFPNSTIVDFIKNRRNDLEEPAKKIMPEITLILEKITQQRDCLITRMSGSGATCFGLFDDKKSLKLAYENLKNEFPQFYIKESKLIYEKI